MVAGTDVIEAPLMARGAEVLLASGLKCVAAIVGVLVIWVVVGGAVVLVKGKVVDYASG